MKNQNQNVHDIKIDELYDMAILTHGFTSYNRDYFFHIEANMWKDELKGQYMIYFVHCYDLSYQTLANSETLLQSWDECFIDFNEYLKAGEPEGFIWGTNWVNAYPGFSIVENSEKAELWTESLKKPMQELQVLSDVYKINLIFHDWKIVKINSQTDLINQAFFYLK